MGPMERFAEFLGGAFNTAMETDLPPTSEVVERLIRSAQLAAWSREEAAHIATCTACATVMRDMVQKVLDITAPGGVQVVLMRGSSPVSPGETDGAAEVPSNVVDLFGKAPRGRA